VFEWEGESEMMDFYVVVMRIYFLWKQESFRLVCVF
jgi:hypothetical protein